MRIRVEGTEAEIAAAVEQITAVLKVQETSRFDANRRSSLLGRAYLSVRGSVCLTVATPPTGTVVRAEAEHTDEPRRLPRSGRLSSAPSGCLKPH